MITVKAYKAQSDKKRMTIICVNGETKKDVQDSVDKIFKERVRAV